MTAALAMAIALVGRAACPQAAVDGQAAASSKPPYQGRVEIRMCDLCGTATAIVAETEADAGGRFRAAVPMQEDPALRPAWILIRRGENLNEGGVVWTWPAGRPDFGEPRLRQSRVTGANFGLTSNSFA